MLALNERKNRKMYEEKVEGIIVRSRERCHEHGEKNSWYFLNLEKRDHISKETRSATLAEWRY